MFLAAREPRQKLNLPEPERLFNQEICCRDKVKEVHSSWHKCEDFFHLYWNKNMIAIMWGVCFLWLSVGLLWINILINHRANHEGVHVYNLKLNYLIIFKWQNESLVRSISKESGWKLNFHFYHIISNYNMRLWGFCDGQTKSYSGSR